MGDSLLLMVIALVVLGPRRLPQVGRQIGKLMYEFRKASNDFKFQMEEELRNAEEADRRKREEAERQRALADAQQAAAQAQSAAAQAVNAAAQAQNAAQTAQTAAELSQAPEAGSPPHEENALRGDPGSPPHEEMQLRGDPGPGAPTATAAPIETSNIYDGTYAEPATESGLRVQPPSTGEPVQAARPWQAAIENDAADGSGSGADDIPLKKDVAAEETHVATESASHHG